MKKLKLCAEITQWGCDHVKVNNRRQIKAACFCITKTHPCVFAVTGFGETKQAWHCGAIEKDSKMFPLDN